MIVILRDQVYDETCHEKKATPRQRKGDAPGLVLAIIVVSADRESKPSRCSSPPEQLQGQRRNLGL